MPPPTAPLPGELGALRGTGINFITFCRALQEPRCPSKARVGVKASLSRAR